jgi:hypothetical protein
MKQNRKRHVFLSRTGEEYELDGTLLRKRYLNEVGGRGPGPRRCGGAVMAPRRRGGIVQSDRGRHRAWQETDAVAATAVGWQPGRLGEQLLEMEEYIVHDVALHLQQRQCRPTSVLVPVPDELECAPAEVPQYRVERFQPLYAKYHVVRTKGEPVTIDGELLAPDGHR